MALIKWLYDTLPVFDCVEYAAGYEGSFALKAKDEKECWRLYNEFLNTVTSDKLVKAYRLGLRPDYPVPVSRYFIEVDVEDYEPLKGFYLNLWTRRDRGRLEVK